MARAVIGAVIALGAVVVVLVVLVLVLVHGQAVERREWVEERRHLVDRAIAQHTGEVIALDRAQRAPKDREPPKLVEGLS